MDTPSAHHSSASQYSTLVSTLDRGGAHITVTGGISIGGVYQSSEYKKG